MSVTTSDTGCGVGAAWSLPPDSRLLWSNWESGHILYQAASGETHYLNVTGAAVLERLGEGPGSLAEICRHIESVEGLPAEETLADHVAALLDRFGELGLVTRCNSAAGA